MTTQEQKNQEFAQALAKTSEAADEMVTALLRICTVAALLVDIVKKLREIEPMLGSPFPSSYIFTHDEKGNLIHLNKEPE